ncbi:Ig-like domain-containing protein [Syntrophobacter fumaroxidans]|uniref:Putative outer membrane adhesin like protein n=1 Tax=Syntrophobacter fumaroxidans (strain DSM 10017 / MPOB) TaxID=335543 RepID=A0LKU1_SYNFM|nr:Ig-like domain-containing protein [Syntrophobacter fumaroxidans]ABK18043.1 putative outer membrane adhesin like protein [Syntrophobacter fumaroxidans MPOB]
MFKKLFCLVVFLSLALVLPVQPGSACDPPVFGPERFERGSGPPVTVTRGFAGSETGAEFEVWIRNGELYGRHRVTSGTIYLNGKKIVSSGELKAHVPLIRRRVSLNASNEIGVRLEGKPGSFLTVTIVDHRHPSVSLSASPQTIAPGGSSTLTWSSTDATICVIDHGVGWVAPTGSRKVRPRRTTTYTIYAYGHHEVVSAKTTVTVGGAGPAVGDDVASTPEGTPVTVNVLANDTGSGLVLAGVTQGAHGAVSANADGTATYTPEPGFTGTDQFTYTVQDDHGATATGTVTITVTSANDAPVANAQTLSTNEDTAVSITLTGTDADGDALSFTVTSSPAHGTLSGTAPNLTYTPAAGYHGSDAFEFKVNDGKVDSAAATVSITVTSANDAPVANAQTLSTNEDTAVSITLTGTDADGFAFKVNDGKADSAAATVSITVTSANDAPVANAQTLSTNEDTAVSITLTGTDADGDTLSFTVTAPPAHGTLSGTAPSLTYTPAANYNGADGFAFKVNDGKADSAAATVSITVTSANDAPVANAQTLSTNEDTALSITLTGTDADGDTLSFTVTTSPAHGTLSGTAPNLTYTPAAGYHGPDAFEFKVNDGKADSAAAAVSITVNAVNHPPAAADDSASTEAGKAVDIAVLANDTDPDGDTLLVSGFTQGANGSVSGGANGVLVYSPNAGFSGEDGFTYTVDDGKGGSASAAVKVTVNALAALSLTIVSPSEGAFIESAAVMVRGTVANATGAETGVTVNGVTAEVYGNEFVANHVVLVEGENTLTAKAADTGGNALEASVVVNADPSADTIRIAANVESGIPSLEVTLGVRGSFSFSQSTIGCAGPAEPEYLETGAKEYKVRLSVEGIYYFTVEAVDNLNNVRADTAAIVVLNRNNLDALLQAKWDGMKAALIAGNSPGALAYFAASSRERYGEVFEHLAAGLPSIASGMREIELIYAKGGTAKYRIKREEQVQGQVYDITYYVYFLRDAAGIWGIDRF